MGQQASTHGEERLRLQTRGRYATHTPYPELFIIINGNKKTELKTLMKKKIKQLK